MSGTLKAVSHLQEELVTLVVRKIHPAGEQFGDLRGPRRLDGQVLLELYVETWTDIEGAIAERRVRFARPNELRRQEKSDRPAPLRAPPRVRALCALPQSRDRAERWGDSDIDGGRKAGFG